MKVSREQLRQIIREVADSGSSRLISDADTGRRHNVTVMATARHTVRLVVGNSMSIEMSPDDARWLADALSLAFDSSAARG